MDSDQKFLVTGGHDKRVKVIKQYHQVVSSFEQHQHNKLVKVNGSRQIGPRTLSTASWSSL